MGLHLGQPREQHWELQMEQLLGELMEKLWAILKEICWVKLLGVQME